ncbi:MAG: hypothetical protein AB7U20_19610, partial [Planctomycetaceae bacterium]
TALLQHLLNDLEEDLLEFTRAVTQSRDVRGFWHEFRQLSETTESFEQLVQVLQKGTDELRAHEAQIVRITSEPASSS